jgi:hypothetical protein
MGGNSMTKDLEDFFDATPRADALITGLRDFGYTLETALADVVDNSITAGATEIEILADFDDGNPSITISDNGVGMTREVLHEVMRPGGRVANAQQPSRDLGRFGLGMKTAAFSQCKKLTVTTYFDSECNSARWDLGYVSSLNKWHALIPTDGDLTEIATRPRVHGTVVVWQELDRLVEGASTKSQWHDFNRKVVSARAHLELVLHRFLQGDTQNKAIKIQLNGVELVPNDPFFQNHPATICSPIDKIPLNSEIIDVQSFTLPHHSKMSQADWDAAGGHRGHMAEQGFYLYRARRLIVHGTWFGLHRRSATTQLARVCIDIPTTMDAEWKVNVLKASASPPLAIRERLSALIPTLSSVSQRVYNNRGTALTESNRDPLWRRNAVHDGISYTINTEHPYLGQYLEQCTPKEKKRLQRLLHVIESGLPLDALFVDLAGSPAETHTPLLEDEGLRELVRTIITSNKERGFSVDETAQLLQVIDPFKSQWAQVGPLIELFRKENTP